MKKKYKWMVGDVHTHELEIFRQATDEEADGEFIFDTLAEAKEYCLERINSELAVLKNVKKRIEAAK